MLPGGSLLKKQKIEVRSKPEGGLQGWRDAATSTDGVLLRAPPQA